MKTAFPPGMGMGLDCQSQGFLSKGRGSQSSESRDCPNDFCPKSPRNSPGIFEFFEQKYDLLNPYCTQIMKKICLNSNSQ